MPNVVDENGQPLATIVEIADELERTHLTRSQQVLQCLEHIREPEDEMGQTERRSLSRRYDSGV
ncbi:uncharacterized protein [Drosophila pseudoobscura]|uniref:Uncharacterized protein n=1 Tax=Drosophila pseudoobscura pseudoobscura TaxID=46245 RepID=A0A6I8V4M4_DROPS|nr:uncharacterized protein LOC6898474 [Drosophila pseudoobscura]